MAKSQKKPAAPRRRPYPKVGDKGRPCRSETVYALSRVHQGSGEVDLHVPGTNLQSFRGRVDNLTFVERKTCGQNLKPIH